MSSRIFFVSTTLTALSLASSVGYAQDSLSQQRDQTVSISLMLGDLENQADRSFNSFVEASSRDDVAGRGGVQQGVNADRLITPKQDPLTIVPLPSSVLAGFGLLGGIAGVRKLRRR